MVVAMHALRACIAVCIAGMIAVLPNVRAFVSPLGHVHMPVGAKLGRFDPDAVHDAVRLDASIPSPAHRSSGWLSPDGNGGCMDDVRGM